MFMVENNDHIVIIRTSGSIMDINSYNCQELGLAKALVKKGLKVTLILAGSKFEHNEFIIDNKKVNLYYLSYVSINQSLAWFNSLYYLLNKLAPSCIQIHEFGMYMSYRVVKWAKKHKVRTVLIQGNYQETQKTFFNQLEFLFNKTFGKYILNNVDAIGCKTPMASNYICKYKKRRTFKTNIGLDTDKFISYNIIDWRKKLNIENRKVLLYVGALEKRRNPHFLLDIINSLSDEYVMVIVGNGNLEESLRQRIEKDNLTNKCIMTGKLGQKDLPSLYKISDLFLLPSSYEIYGMVILESMYFGVPVISSLTAGSQAIISDKLDGFILKDFCLKTWIKAIENYYLYEVDKIKMKARNKIKEELVWDKACNAFIELYKKKE